MEQINFIITNEQAEDICKHYGKHTNELEDWQICELLDRLIDDAIYG
jgi:hypothetical protein